MTDAQKVTILRQALIHIRNNCNAARHVSTHCTEVLRKTEEEK